ncbi:MAG: glycoside hydrolase family 9 protein [Bacteroidota bacterium]
MASLSYRGRLLLGLVAACLAGPGTARASDLVAVQPVNDRILMVHLDDGYLDYSAHDRLGGSGREAAVVNTPLDVALAEQLGSYILRSADDTSYAEGLSPLQVGRKSKTVEMPHWPPGAYVYEHWLYLVWPQPLKSGQTYTLDLDRIVPGASATFTYSAQTMRSEAVHVNQVGYAADAPLKVGYVFHYMGSLGPADFSAYEGQPCSLNHVETGHVAFESRLTFRGANTEDSLHGEYWVDSDVWSCDFSAFKTPGEYQLVVEGVGHSFPFKIGPDVYEGPYTIALRGLYHQRSGPERSAPFSDWYKGEDHVPGLNGHTVLYSTFRWMDHTDQDEIFDLLPAAKTTTAMPNAWGGWHDAADWDRHPEHLIITNQLLLAYAMNPGAFGDGDLNIPESGNGLPDMVDEAAYGVDFFLRLEGPTGGISGGLETSGHPTDDPSYRDPYTEWYQYGEEPLASFWTAASAAQLAHALTLAEHPVRAAAYLADARRIYAWAQANLQPGDLQVRKAEDRTTRDLRMQAAAWLFVMTGEAAYHDQFKADNVVVDGTTPLRRHQHHNQTLAVWPYVMHRRAETDADLYERLRRAAVTYADTYVEAAERRTLRVANQWDMPAVAGTITSPRLTPLIVGHHLSTDHPERAERYLRYLYTSADYFLGGNPLNMTWMTGIGDRSPKQVMHLDSWYDGLVEPPPGLVPYGPQHPRFEWGWEGSWTPGHHYLSCYPEHTEWPLAELWFDSRYPVMSAEFTVWQTMGPTSLLYSYLHSLDAGGRTSEPVASSADAPSWPAAFRLHAPYPNPARGVATVSYDLAEAGPVVLALFDALGRQVRKIADGPQQPGLHTVPVDLSGLAAGTYFIRFQAGSHQHTQAVLRRP